MKALNMKSPEVLGEAAGCGVLLAARHQRTRMLEEPPLLQQPADGKAARTAGAWRWRSCLHCRAGFWRKPAGVGTMRKLLVLKEPAEPEQQNQDESPFPTAVALRYSLLTKLNMVPDGKEKCLQGSDLFLQSRQ